MRVIIVSAACPPLSMEQSHDPSASEITFHHHCPAVEIAPPFPDIVLNKVDFAAALGVFESQFTYAPGSD